MRIEKELLKRIANHGDAIPSHFIYEICELLAQHEPAPIPQRAPMTQREAYQRGYAAAREEYKQKVINAFGEER